MKILLLLRQKYRHHVFDVNNLKMANDTLGHAAGNKLILATAEELTKLYPENAYRVGGDEFIVLLQGKGSYLEIDKKIKKILRSLISQ